MKRHIPKIIALAFILLFCLSEVYRQRTSRTYQAQIQLLEAKLGAQNAVMQQRQQQTQPEPVLSVAEEAVAVIKEEVPEALPQQENSEEKNAARKRMMGSMAKMMENPTMNKVMQASQRGAVGALYADMIGYLGLNADETNYFMDLLMYRQMKNVDMAMKMMGGNLSEEEKKALQAEMKEATETVKTEMEKFLNNPEDYAEWEFYEKTMGERMMLSQMDQNLSGTDEALSDEAYRNLLGMMSDEKGSFNFTSDLSDEKNTDLSPKRFSKQNIQNHINDVKQLNERITARAQGMLTQAQYEEFAKSLKATTDMQLSQLEMAGQMLGGGE